MKEHNGFFKTGDYIEVSGIPIGIVINANAYQFQMKEILSTHDVLLPDIKVYLNDKSHYKDKYWLHAGTSPIEYRELEPVPLRLN